MKRQVSGKEKPLVSICIPTRNRCGYLQNTLDSLVAQEEFLSGKVEIVVSDNASTDGTRELCRKYAARFYNFQYFRNDSDVIGINFPLALSRGTGLLRKLSNDTLCYQPGKLKFFCDTARKYQDTRPLIVFTNCCCGSLLGHEVGDELLDVRQFTVKASYLITWIACMSLWDEECDGLVEDFEHCSSKNFWQLEKIYSLLEYKGQGLILDMGYGGVQNAPKQYTGREAADIFYTEWLQIVQSYADKGCLTTADVEDMKRDLLCINFITIFYAAKSIETYHISEIEDLQRFLIGVYADKPYFREFAKRYRLATGDDYFREYEDSGDEVEAVPEGRRPLVSICIPTYNRADFLKMTLDSLVEQEEFLNGEAEIVVSDNASTDGTEELCREYAARFCNLLYHRNEKNAGATVNFLFALSSAKGVLRKLGNDVLVYKRGSLKFFCDMACKYRDDKPVLVFSNGNCSMTGQYGEGNVLNIRQCIVQCGYALTWIGCMSFWDEDCKNLLKDAECFADENFWHVKKTFSLLEQKGRGILLEEPFCSVMIAPKEYEGQQLFDIFYTEWLQVIDNYRGKGILSHDDVEQMMEKVLLDEFFSIFYTEKQMEQYHISAPEKLQRRLIEAYSEKTYFQEFARKYKSATGDVAFSRYEKGGSFWGYDNRLSHKIAGKTARSGAGIVSADGQLVVGAGTYIGPGCRCLSDKLRVIIGRYSSIGADVTFGSETPMDCGRIATSALLYEPGSKHFRSRHIIIGSDVWIGDGARLAEGVYIHSGAVVESGSVVTEDVPAYAVAAGNPAHVARYRFPEEIRENLAEIRFWNWPYDKIMKHRKLMADPSRFVETFAFDGSRAQQETGGAIGNLCRQGYRMCFFASDYPEEGGCLDHVLEQYSRQASPEMALVVVAGGDALEAEERSYINDRLLAYDCEKVFLYANRLNAEVLQNAEFYIAGTNYSSLWCLDCAERYGIKILSALDDDIFRWC